MEEFLRPLPKLKRNLPQIADTPKGIMTKGQWEKRKFREDFKRQKAKQAK